MTREGGSLASRLRGLGFFVVVSSDGLGEDTRFPKPKPSSEWNAKDPEQTVFPTIAIPISL
jgi:hypothetical protein